MLIPRGTSACLGTPREARQWRRGEHPNPTHEIGLTQRTAWLVEEFEQLQPERPGEEFALLLGRVPRPQVLPGCPRLVDDGVDAET